MKMQIPFYVFSEKFCTISVNRKQAIILTPEGPLNKYAYMHYLVEWGKSYLYYKKPIFLH